MTAYPLSSEQRWIWRHGAASRAQLAIELHGEIDAALIGSAVSAAAATHGVLRTTYRDVTGLKVPVAEVLDRAEVTISEREIEDDDRRGTEAALRDCAEAEALELLGARQPIRVLLLRLRRDRAILLVTVHPANADAWTLFRLFEELTGNRAPESELGYPEFAEWQSEIASSVDEDAIAFWRMQRGGSATPPPWLAAIRPERRAQESIELELDGRSLERVRAAAARAEASISDVLLACLGVAVARMGGPEHATYLLRADARGALEELADLWGVVDPWIPLQVQYDGQQSFRELVRSVTKTRARAIECLEHAPDDREAEAFTISFDCAEVPPAGSIGRARARVLWDDACPVRSDLRVSCRIVGQRLEVRVTYDALRLTSADVEQVADAWATCLQSAGENVARAVSALNVLSAARRRELLVDWNATGRELDERTVHEIITERAASTPDAVALECDGVHVTYAALDDASGSLAAELVHRGVRPGDRVGICLRRTPLLVISLLAVLKTGAAYLPLEPSHPAARVRAVLADSGAKLVLTERAVMEVTDGADQLVVDADWTTLAGRGGAAPGAAVDPGAVAYVIYTSGSTGLPKGVLVPHRAIVNYLHHCIDAYGIGAGGTSAVHSSVAFDLMVTSVFAPLFTGGCVRLIVDERGIEGLEECVRNVGPLSVFKLTPAHLDVLSHQLSDSERARAARSFVVGGEQLLSETLRPWAESAPDALVFNEYGPTEATVGCSVFASRLDGLSPGPVPIGKPIRNTRLYVLDGALEPVAPGGAGQLFIAGVGLAHGYWARPNLTSDRFVPEPFSGFGERMYATGDLVRRARGGELEFIGRVDHQVKIRGYRIELGDIEAAMASHAGVRQAVATVFEDGGKRFLAGYFVSVPGAGPSAAELRTFLSRQLPDYMLPNTFVELRAFPLTSNGKVDRKALPAPTRNQAADAPYAAPETAAEEALAAIWADVLRVDRVGRLDDFFALGGDSILAIQLIARAAKVGLRFTPQQLFLHPRLWQLASVAAAGGVDTSTPEIVLNEADAQRVPEWCADAYPASRLQVGMLYHNRVRPEAAEYVDASSYHLALRFDEPAMREAARLVMARHPILRSSFDLSSFSEPMILVHREVEPPITVTDLRGIPGPRQDATIHEMVLGAVQQSFDVARAPMFRLEIARRDEESFQFTIVFHHAILDGWSRASLLTELFECYSALASRRALEPRPPIAASFRELVAAERAAERSSDARAFWRDRLAGASLLRLPRVVSRGPAGFPHTCTVPIAADVWAALQGIARRIAVPPKAVLLAVHLRCLAALGGRRDVVTGVVSHGRPNTPDGERVLGLFLNTLPLRIDMRREPITDLARRAFAADVDALPFRHYPLSAIQAEHGGALFESLFGYVNFHVQDRIAGIANVLGTDGFENTGFSLLVMFSGGEHASLHISMESSEFSAEQCQQVAKLYREALEDAAHRPDAPATFASVPEDERRSILEAYDATPLDRREGARVDDAIAAFARVSPHAIAISSEGQQIDYAELDRRANRVASRLRRRGIAQEARVGVLARRSVERIIAMLGIWRAGAVYVPLNPGWGASRVRWVASDASLSLMLVERGAEGSARGLQDCVGLEDALSEIGPDDVPISTTRNASSLACVAYAFGPGQRPRGVMLHHGGLDDQIAALQHECALAPGDAVLHEAAVESAAGLLEIVWPLASGARIAVLPAKDEAREHVEAMRREGISVPSLAEHRSFGLDEHGLGWVCRSQVVSGHEPRTIVTPRATARLCVVNEDLELAPIGVAGELCIASDPSTRGYFGLPAVTAERFSADPFGASGCRLLRTGTLARLLPDRTVELLGQGDDWLPSGRLDVAAVERALTSHPEIGGAAVMVRHTDDGPRVVAYYSGRSANAPASQDLREHVLREVAESAVPSVFVPVDSLRLDPGGRVDSRTRWAMVVALPDSSTALGWRIEQDDWSGWRRPELERERIDADLRFWARQLAGAPAALEIPTDHPRPAVLKESEGAVTFGLSADVVSELDALARAEGASLFTVLLAAWQLLLARYSRQSDVVVGTPVVASFAADPSSPASFVVNTVAIRTRIDEAASFRELLRQVRETALTAYAHPFLPFDELVGHLAREHDTSRAAVVQAAFVLQGAPMTTPWPERGRFDALAAEPHIGKLDLVLSMVEGPQGLLGTLAYNRELFDESTVERMSKHLGVLLASAVAAPEEMPERLPLVTERERHTVLFEWNRTHSPFPRDACVHHLFEAQVERTPDAIALAHQDEQLTYAALDARAGRFAARLRELGVSTDDRVGLCLDRSLETLVAVLGVLKAGAAYVPLDPEYPADRLALMVEDAKVRVVVTRGALRARLSDTGAACVDIDGFELGDGPRPGSRRAACASPDNLAYVIYTSGSTGRPKGVAMPHRPLVNLLTWQIAEGRLKGPVRTLQFTSLSFDVSFQETFATWCSGGTLVLIEEERRRDPGELLRHIESQSVERLFVPFVALQSLAIAAEVRGRPTSLREVITAGEALRVTSGVARLFSGDALLENQYGPSETHVVTAFPLVGESDGWAPLPPIGRAIANARAYVLDKDGEATPVGVPGELHLGGESIARGYLARPSQTAERFVPDRFSEEPGGRAYRTGDVVRSRPDANLDFLGRADHQLKIRGYRVELGEVEAALSSHVAVRDAAVVARADVGGERRLVAYVVAANGAAPTSAELQAWLSSRLPEYMIPSAFVALDRLPLTPSGKVDRRSLPAPKEAESAAFVAPRNPTEASLCELFGIVLSRKQPVGVHDDFFELGGHSLSATQLAARIAVRIGVDLPLREIWDAPTVARLAERVERARGVADLPPLEPSGPGAPLVPSFGQERLWFLHQLEPRSPMYNIVGAARLRGTVDVDAISRALGVVLERHQVLRTGYSSVDGALQLFVHEPGESPLEHVDLRGVPRDAAHQEILRRAAAVSQLPFDLSRPPPVRALLASASDTEHVLVLVIHHIATDGWSMGTLIRELAVIYDSLRRGDPCRLPPLRLSYADWARWQRSCLEGERLESELRFWREQLAGAPAALALPTDKPRPAVQSSRGAVHRFELRADIVNEVKRLAHAERATLFMTLLAAWNVLLWRSSGQDDIVVGTPIANRVHSDVEPLVGFFVNTLALRTRVSSTSSFREILREVRETTLAAYAHQHLPFDELVAHLAPERDLSRSPVFQVMFSLQNTPTAALELDDLRMEPFEVDSSSAKFDLTMNFVEAASGALHGDIEYCRDLFDATTIERMASHFVTLLAGAVRHPEVPALELPLLTEEERALILGTWNDIPPVRPARGCIHEMFEEQARRTPDAVAAIHGTACVTYDELDRRADAIAAALAQQGVSEPETPIAVCLERGLELLAALLGVLKAGGMYVPIDPRYPQERRAMLLEDSGAVIVIADAASAGLVAGAAPVLEIESAFVPNRNGRRARALPAHAAYVIYTSGSTGRPKGVVIEHRNAAALLDWAHAQFGAEVLSGVLAATSVCFDLSVFELFAPLACGGTVVIAADALAVPEVDAIDRVTLLNTVPSAMAELVRLAVLPASAATVNLAGEPLSTELVDAIYGTGTVSRVFDLYGPSEDTTYSTSALRRRGGRATIGRPIFGTRAYIVDEAFQPVPAGVRGELLLAGAGVTRGYLGRPSLTASRYVPDPHAIASGTRAYRTGDIARFMAGGEIEFLGRADHQVKLRGFRIELGEIEAALRGADGVRESVVLVRDAGQPSARLVAFVVPEDLEHFDSDALRATLARRLPTHMVPAALVALEALPLTPNGKVDRARLIATAADAAPARRDETPPRTPTEKLLAALWAELLHVEPIGATDNFFALGGHSLLATQLVSRIARELGAQLPIRAIFEAPTVAALAERVERARGVAELPPVEPSGPDAPLVPSFGQERLWFLHRLKPESPMYNVVAAARLRGTIQLGALSQALAVVLERHRVLRTGYSSVEGRLQLFVHESAESPLEHVDLRGLPADAAHEEILRRAAEAAQLPFDLTRPPLVRGLLASSTDTEHVLVLVIHHIATDGWSMGILVRELAVAYDAMRRGDPCRLPPLRLDYADWARWQRSWLEGERLESELRFWREQLAGAPAALALPTDKPRPALQSSRGAVHRFELGAEIVNGLKRLAQSERATLFMTLLAAWNVVLWRTSGQDDIVVGTPIANRVHADVEPLVGFFVNTLALRTRVSSLSSFRDIMREVRETTLAAYSHQHLPFDELVRHLSPERDLSRSPLFQVLFALQNAPTGAIDVGDGDLLIESFEAESGTAQFDVSLIVSETPRGAAAALEYCIDLFDDETVRRMAERYDRVLRLALEAPDRPIGELSLVLEDEDALLTEWNHTDAEHSATLVHDRVSDNARRMPDAIAVAFRDMQSTYGELDERSNRIARALAANGVERGDRVGLCLLPSAALPSVILAVLKLGAAFVPLDPTYPLERLRFMVADSTPRLVVTDPALGGVLADRGLVNLDRILAEADLAPEAPLVRAISPDDAAYVIYTSGSTGRPKGTVLSHRGLRNHANAYVEMLGIRPGARIVQFAALGFDASVSETFMALVGGGTLVLERRERMLPGADLGTLLRTQAIEYATLPPAALATTDPSDGAALEVVISAGEACTPEIVRRWASGRRFVNAYGPTEATVCATMYDAHVDDQSTPIGAPIQNVRAHVLDEAQRPTPIGVVGELFIGGAGVGSSYISRPDLTAERFVPDPRSRPGARMYRTGDLARWRADGVLEFFGRMDNQVKLRGFRIELGEIEAALLGHAGVRQTVVVMRSDHGLVRLVAYYTAEPGATIKAPDLRAHLERTLPSYMIPAAFLELDAMPLTPNGKLDRRALPSPAQVQSTAFVPPANALEERLAAIWGDVLGLERVSVEDSVFELGAHSLLVTRVAARIRAELEIDVPMVELFQFRTVRALAEYLSRPSDAAASIEPDRDRGRQQRDAIAAFAARKRKNRRE